MGLVVQFDGAILSQERKFECIKERTFVVFASLSFAKSSYLNLLVMVQMLL